MKALRKTAEGQGHVQLCEVPAFADLRARQDVKALVHPNGREWAD